MKERALFGTTKSVPNRNLGSSNEYFVPQFEVWCGEYTNTQTQTYSNLGTDIDVDLVIVIRHNPQVNDKKILVRYKGVVYKISAINSDDQVNAFDTVTLVRDKSQPQLLPDKLAEK
ncbi:phage head closure protein [Limosilactobacillus sp.]|uniref:phage head closure protein n=1 Tax=Limosilactobacillus sp. TaxID=2773925 RepID=UPI00345EDB5E